MIDKLLLHYRFLCNCYIHNNTIFSSFFLVVVLLPLWYLLQFLSLERFKKSREKFSSISIQALLAEIQHYFEHYVPIIPICNSVDSFAPSPSTIVTFPCEYFHPRVETLVDLIRDAASRKRFFIDRVRRRIS